MCGIVGLVSFWDNEIESQAIDRMLSSLSHRGPDSKGTWQNKNVILGHARLAVVDLSPNGSQPMVGGMNKRFNVVYNGEVYNYKEIKEELEEYNFTTNSDTEVILAAYEKWGAKCVQKFNGMFSFAIWDIEKEELFIARDRLGIKPFYYSWAEGRFIFSSELRAILNSGLIDKELDLSSFEEYLLYQSVYAPKTMMKGILQLMPGHSGYFRKDGSLKIEKYWDIEGVDNLNNIISQGEAVSTLRKKIDKAVKIRMNSDVPLGAFLSGGIDSSAIVASMAENSYRPINTFSISFEEPEFDESIHAKRVADLYNTKHKDIRIKSLDILSYVPDAIDAMDVPTCDGINTFVVSKLTKNAGITVALSGLGGDELFMGYPVHNTIIKLEKIKFLWKFPRFIRVILSRIAVLVLNPRKSDKIKDILLLDNYDQTKILHILRRVLSRRIVNKIIISPQVDLTMHGKEIKKNQKENIFSLSQITVDEINGYTQNILLRDADQMSMAHGLEVRVPFFDHELVEFILSLPDSYKLSNRIKGFLLESLGDKIPIENVNRKKMGFSFPWDNWIRTEMREFCELELSYLKTINFIDSQEIDNLWQGFLEMRNSQITWVNIWSLVVFSSWVRKNNIVEK